MKSLRGALSAWLWLSLACSACSSKKPAHGDAGLGGAGGGGNSDDAGAGTGGSMVAVPLVNPTETQMLSGHGSDDAVPWDFYCSSMLANNRNCTNVPGSGDLVDDPGAVELGAAGIRHLLLRDRQRLPARTRRDRLLSTDLHAT